MEVKIGYSKTWETQLHNVKKEITKYIVVREWSLYEFSPLKFVQAWLVTYHMICCGKYPMCT